MRKTSTLVTAILLSVCVVICIGFFLGFYPGAMVNDTAGVLHSAIEGRTRASDPPIHVALFSALLVFDSGVAPMLFIHLAAYWFSVAVFSIFLWKSGWQYAVLLLIIALFPYNIYLHNVVVKDVLTLGCLLVFFAVAGLVLAKKGPKVGTLVLLLVAMVAVILMRENAITTLPALALSTFVLARLRLVPEKRDDLIVGSSHVYLKGMLVIFGIGLFALFSSTAINGLMKPDRKPQYNYFEQFLFPYDLIGMSVQDGHEGSTEALSEAEKLELERTYYGDQIFWGIKLPPISEKYPDGAVPATEWLREVKIRPRAFLEHRWQTFSKLFDGSGQKPTRYVNRLAGWNYFKSISPEKADKWWPQQSAINDLVHSSWRQVVEKYFHIFPSQTFIPIINVIMIMFLGFMFIRDRALSSEGTMAALMNITAFSYYAPFFLVLHHPEVRYVYPSNVLILFSFPFFIAWIVQKCKLWWSVRVPHVGIEITES